MFGRKKPGPQMPVGPLNGYLTRKPDRLSSSADVDHTPRLFQEYNIAAGQFEVQLNNGLHRRIGSGLRLNQVNYLYASTPQIPGQMRDNYGGFHKRGIDPLSYQKLVDNGPGSQPANPGGPGKVAGNYIVNPGTT